MTGICHSAAALGVSARWVEVEAFVRIGQRAVNFVGLPDTAIRESRERVKAAIANTGFHWPGQRQVIVNLAPANLRKEGSAFDLAIAVGLLQATGQLEAPRARDHLLVGELALDGRVRPVRGALCIADRAARSGRWRGLVVPAANGAEAALAGGIPVFPVESLAEAARFLAGAIDLPAAPPPDGGDGRVAAPCFSGVRGQPGAVRAALVAAAGGHELLLVGPPGSGKTMIAERVPGILPPLGERERIEATKIHSVAGILRDSCVRSPPFRAPHHTVSAAGLLGGGPRASPGEITLAHRGVLFLDELPEFERRSLEGLREPLERGEITVVRAGYRVRFPCRFLLVAAMNPCPCGRHGVERRECDCPPSAVARYRARVSGPLLDRFDLQVRVPPVRAGELGSGGTEGDSTLLLRERVRLARERQAARGRINASLEVASLQRWAPLARKDEAHLERAAEKLRLSARAVVRVRRVARTLADLEGRDAVSRDDLLEALSFRVEG